MPYGAKIVKDSINDFGARLTSFELIVPKWVQAEVNTHKMLPKNSASSRAIPAKTMLQRIKEDPVLPVFWGKNQKGMQAREELTGDDRAAAENLWRMAGTYAINTVEQLIELGLHKQIANRLVEPWMFTTVLITGTEFDHFFALRDHPDAQPELKESVAIAHELYRTNKPLQLHPGQWHLPYVDDLEAEAIQNVHQHNDPLVVPKVSSGRCARLSYLTQDGKRSVGEDFRLFHDLKQNGHMSPLEHVAQCLSRDEWREMAAKACYEWIENRVPVGNLWGWRQFRKMVTLEHNFHAQQLST